MLAPEQIQQVTEALAGAREELVESMAAELWDNPFWADRFGEPGRNFITQDCQYHVDTLISTVQIDQAGFMARHYKWLQGVLVHRGMCSHHLRETIALFDRQIAARLPHVWPLIQPYHAAAAQGLAYESAACQALEQFEERLSERVIARLWAENPEWELRLGLQGESLCRREMRYHLSYLQDALGYQEPELFTAYLAWFTAYKEARRIVPRCCITPSPTCPPRSSSCCPPPKPARSSS